jgi:hypothetical protein
MLRRIILAICLTLPGCVQNEYDIELTPKGEGLERKFRVKWRESKTQDELDRLAKEYGRESPAANSQHRFEGEFAGRMPNDIGGHGMFVRYDSPLGSAAMYVERFRGDDDLAGVMERQKARIDHAVDLLIGWLEAELKDDSRWPALHTFLHEEFRRDMFNLWLRLLTTPRDENDEDRAKISVMMAMFHYLVEHAYLTPEELPEWKRANRNDYNRLLTLYRKLILTRMDDGQVPSPDLKFLDSRPQLEESLRGYLKTTNDYSLLHNKWLEERQTDPDAKEPDPLDVVTKMFWEVLKGGLVFDYDQLALSLNLDRVAIFSNGKKSEDSHRLDWGSMRLPNKESPPELAYAVWDEPNELAQKLIFDRTVLAGPSLLEYCLWYRGLTDAERTAWDDFLATLKPGPELKDRLKGFRFPDEPDSDAPLAAPAVEKIIGGLSKAASDDATP